LEKNGMDPIVMKSLLSFLVKEITGKEGGSDCTTFLWDNGSIDNTIPATPDTLRGSELFKEFRKLPPKPKFSGSMNINRQGGVIKSYRFYDKNKKAVTALVRVP
jgi:hypothetical protein